MKLIQIEDGVDFAKSAAGFFDISLQDIGYVEECDLVKTGSTFDEIKDNLDKLVLLPGEKTVFIVDGNLNYTVGKDDARGGNGFYLMADWLKAYGEKIKDDPQLQKALREDVEIMLNPSFREYVQKGFHPFDTVSGVCQSLGIGLFPSPKAEGLELMLDEIRRFVVAGPRQTIEGGRPIAERK